MTHLHTMTTRFLRAEDGAVTVDFVPLLAIVVGLGLAVMGVVSGGVENLSGDIDTQLVDQTITTEFAPTIVRIRARVN